MSISQDGTQHASKSAAAIDRARAQGRAALIGYLPAGYPSVKDTIAAGIALAELLLPLASQLIPDLPDV